MAINAGRIHAGTNLIAAKRAFLSLCCRIFLRLFITSCYAAYYFSGTNEPMSS